MRSRELRELSKEEIFKKKYSTSFTTKEMPIRNTLKFHPIPIQIVKIKLILKN